MSVRTRLAGALTSFLLLVAGTAAEAQTNPLVLPSSYGSTGAGLVTTTVGGWTVSINQCALLNQGSIPGNDCAGAEVAVTVTGDTLSLVFQNVNTANPLLTSAAGSSYSDLNYHMTVSAPAAQNIWYASLTMSGNVKAGDSADLGLLSSGISSYVTLTTSLANSPVLTSIVVPPTHAPPALSQDTRVGTTGAIVGDNTMNIMTVTDTFRVPEPISASLFAVGVAGLGIVRRRRMRPKT